MPKPQPNYLIAEDADLLYAVAEIMKAHVHDWGTDERSWKVEIKKANGVNDALSHKTLLGYAKSGGLRTLGVVVDADDKPQERWASIRDFCRICKAQAPAVCPRDGLIVDQMTTDSGIELRFGAWLMPDNGNEGIIENFCFDLVPQGNDGLLKHAASSVGQAKYLGAPFIPSLNTNAKARLHTWLAWQDPPGQSIGRAIASRTLLPDADSARPFVEWFRKLYDV